VSWSRPEHAAEWKRDFGLRLRSQRLAKGMSQMQLALAADIDPTYISAVEQGAATWPWSTSTRSRPLCASARENCCP